MRKKICWPYIIAAYVSLLSLGLLDNTRGPFLPDFTTDLNFTDTQGSLLFVVPALFAFVGCQLSNALIYRIHPLRGLQYGMLIMGCGFLALAKVTGMWGLILCGGLFGIGFGMINVFQHINIQMGATEKTRRKLLSGLHTMYAFSSLVAPLLIKYLYALQWNWRRSFILVATVPIIMSSLFFLFKRDGKKLEKPLEKTTKGHVTHYIYVGFAIACYIASELAISSRITLYVLRYTETTPELATSYLAVFFLLLFVGRALCIVFDSNKWKSKNILYWSLALSLLCFICGLWISPWFMSLCGLFMSPCFAASMDYVFDVFKEKSSEAMAYVMGMNFLVVVLMHYAIGAVGDILGLRVALTIGPALLALSLLMVSLRSRFFKELTSAGH